MNNTIEVLENIIKYAGTHRLDTEEVKAIYEIINLAKKGSDALKAVEDREANGNCYYCGKPIENLSANPGEWGIPLCHSDEPGKVKPHHIGCVSDRLEAVESAGDMLPEKKRMPEIYGGECVERQKAGEFNKGIDLCQPILAKQILKNKELEAKINEFTTEYGEEITTAENLRLIDKDVDLLFRRIARSRIENKKLKERIEWWSDKCDDLNAETGELLLERDKLKEQQLTEDEIQMIVFRSGITLNKEEAYRIAKAIIKARKDKKGD